MTGWQTITTTEASVTHHVERVLYRHAQTACGRVMPEHTIQPRAFGARCRHCEKLLEKRERRKA